MQRGAGGEAAVLGLVSFCALLLNGFASSCVLLFVISQKMLHCQRMPILLGVVPVSLLPACRTCQRVFPRQLRRYPGAWFVGKQDALRTVLAITSHKHQKAPRYIPLAGEERRDRSSGWD